MVIDFLLWFLSANKQNKIEIKFRVKLVVCRENLFFPVPQSVSKHLCKFMLLNISLIEIASKSFVFFMLLSYNGDQCLYASFAFTILQVSGFKNLAAKGENIRSC